MCFHTIFCLGKATPSLAGMCAGINAHRGGFLAYHRMDDYAMPGLMRQGIEKLEKRREARGWSANSVGFRRVRNAFWKGRRACFERRVTDGCIELYACLSRGAIVSPGSFQRVPRFPACHASCFPSVARKHSEILSSAQGSGLMFCSPRERLSKTKFSGETERIDAQCTFPSLYKYIFRWLK